MNCANAFLIATMQYSDSFIVSYKSTSGIGHQLHYRAFELPSHRVCHCHNQWNHGRDVVELYHAACLRGAHFQYTIGLRQRGCPAPDGQPLHPPMTNVYFILKMVARSAIYVEHTGLKHALQTAKNLVC